MEEDHHRCVSLLLDTFHGRNGRGSALVLEPIHSQRPFYRDLRAALLSDASYTLVARLALSRRVLYPRGAFGAFTTRLGAHSGLVTLHALLPAVTSSSAAYAAPLVL